MPFPIFCRSHLLPARFLFFHLTPASDTVLSASSSSSPLVLLLSRPGQLLLSVMAPECLSVWEAAGYKYWEEEMEQDNIQTPPVLTLMADFRCVRLPCWLASWCSCCSPLTWQGQTWELGCAVLLSVVLSSPVFWFLLCLPLPPSFYFLFRSFPLTVARHSLGSAGRMKVRSHSYVRSCLAVGGGVAAGVQLLVQVSDSAPWVHLRRRWGQGSHRHFNGLRASLPLGQSIFHFSPVTARLVCSYWSPSLAINAKIIILYYGRNLSVSLVYLNQCAFPRNGMQTN